MKHSASVEVRRGALGQSLSRKRLGVFLRLTISLAALLVLLTPARIVLSQSATTSRISGTVTDPNKAVLPGVEVELYDPATNQRVKQTTDDSGKYVFPTVAPGVYSLTVTKQGFRTTSFATLKVEVAKSYDIDAVLEVGEVKEIVQVAAGAEVELQKSDSTVGNVVSGAIMPRFPALTRTANELLTLQPLATPNGEIAGSRADQSTFLLDGIDITNQSVGGLGTYARLPIDGIEEFRVGVANPTAAFGRGAGGQVSVISRHGSNDYHGAAYWYHQNDNLNAASWSDKRLGRTADGKERVRKAELKDNRFGFRFGGPIYPWKDKAFLFLNYEGRRFPRSTSILRVVPTDTLRAGILRFRDASGAVVSYNLATSALCGPAGNETCDPRGLGLSPTISALFSKLPAGNDPSSGDGLNTIGFRGNVGNPLNNDYYNARVDYNLSSNWRVDAAFRYFGELNGLATPASIVGGNLLSLGKSPNRQNMISAGITGNFTPTLIGEFRFGWVRIRTAQDVTRPDASAGILGIPGTESGITDGQSNIALDLGARGGFNSLLSEPIDVDTQVARKQANDNRNFQYNADMTWIKGDHTFQFGSHLRYLPTKHFRDDKVLGALGALVAQLDGDFNVSIPGTSRPPTCSATITKNCLTAADVSNYNRFFASATGIIDNVSVLAVRDGELKPLPFGELLEADTKLWAPEFYFQDVWRIRPSLTLTFGINYGWQTPPTEKLGRQSVQVDGQTLKVQTAREYLRAREEAARAGKIFNPPIAFQPIKESGRSGVFDTDWNNIAPRVAASWNPSFKNKFLYALFGDRKTVIRGGYSLVFDRQNTVQSVIIPTLGVAFAQTLNVTAPLCNVTGGGGKGCSAASTNPSLSAFRVGVDGKIPIPTVPVLGKPISPFWGIRPGAVGPPFTGPNDLILDPEILSFQVDPTIQVGENHAIDFTWQRELKGNMLLEAGYVGRFARKLPQSMSFGQVPYMFLDTASNQTFAQAFDAVANQLRTGTPAASVTVQPWFENLYPALGATPGGTRALATSQQANFISGNISTIFQAIDVRRLRAGQQPFNNYVAQTLFLRASTGLSNYNGLFVTLHKRLSQGLLFTVNYTFSRSLDQLGAIQNAANVMPNSFDLNAEYGPSPFDINHLFNTSWLYDLPFGRSNHLRSSFRPLNKVLEGWYLSGIFTAQSGDPLTVTENAFVWGGSRFLGFASGALSKVDPLTFGNTVNKGIPGTNNIGVSGNPATGGSGLNLFGDPAAVYNQFRRVNISTDGRAGRANPLRGLPRWNLDTSLGKKTNITERVNMVFSADFFNVLNKVDFANPGLSLTGPTTFGVITTQFVPANRTSGSRWIQLSMRVEF